CSGSRICDGRRQSTLSDSGDTGIGTYCSDSMEGRFSYLVPGLHGSIISPVFAPILPFQHALVISPRCWNRSSHRNQQTTSPLEALSSMDMKGCQPIRRSSSFTKLSSGLDNSSMKTSSYSYNPGTQGSLDRGVLYGYRKKSRDSNINLYLPLSSTKIGNSLLQRSPGAKPSYGYKHSSRSTGLITDLSPSSSHSSPVKYSLNYCSPHQPKVSVESQQAYDLQSSLWTDCPVSQNSDRGKPIQPAVRTQMWLTEQMEYRPKLDIGSEPAQTSAHGTEDCGVDGLSLLTKNDNESCDGNKVTLYFSHKQQIMQLHVWIRENEHRARQVLHSQRRQFDESAMGASCKPPSDKLCCDKEFNKKLALAELEVLHLNLFFKQVTLKYTEEIQKLEEKIKTRDRYITSLKKKCQRESEQNQEKQQRVETIEKYLSDLPSLNEVQVQSKQQEKLQEKNKHLENTVVRLQKSIEEGCALIQTKDVMIEMQAKTEKKLIASVQSLCKKVQQCLDDGVRLPVQDFKNLEGENSQLLQQQDYSSRVPTIMIQKDEIERLTSKLMVMSFQIYTLYFLFIYLELVGFYTLHENPIFNFSFICELFIYSVIQDKGQFVQGKMSEVDELLKEMSLCLLDLQGFCGILAQRAQGKEPNLSLLLGMKSLSISAEEKEYQVGEEELSSKIIEVGLLRRGIDELRKAMAEYCPRDVDEGCATQ
uniref:Centrosomal protein of 85 kDa-like n=1 Tax=Fundulus heteroclitus TaxID=8078 RepID=A0A3Q2QY89_FUNHE